MLYTRCASTNHPSFRLNGESVGPALTRLDSDQLVDATRLDADILLPAVLFDLVDRLGWVPGSEGV